MVRLGCTGRCTRTGSGDNVVQRYYSFETPLNGFRDVAFTGSACDDVVARGITPERDDEQN